MLAAIQITNTNKRPELRNHYSFSVSHRENSTQLLYGTVHRHCSDEVECVYGNTAYILSDLRQHPPVFQPLLTADSETDKAITNAIG